MTEQELEFNKMQNAIREQLAREHNWEQQEKNWEAQQKNWEAQQKSWERQGLYWLGVFGVAVFALVTKIFTS